MPDLLRFVSYYATLFSVVGMLPRISSQGTVRRTSSLYDKYHHPIVDGLVYEKNHDSTTAVATPTQQPSSPPTPTAAPLAPVKIFLLSGQSNMVGMGSLKHLQLLIHGMSDGPDCPCEYQTLWQNETGEFRTRKDVYVAVPGHTGPLRADGGFAARDTFGPELGFGWALADAWDTTNNNTNTATTNNTIVLIKAAYGGRSLAVDFRPPASGEGHYRNVKPHVYGWEYRQMIDDFNTAIADLKHIVPGYDETKRGYEIAGFVWFQGWNDMLNWDTVNEYAFNLANLIRDVRLEMGTPNLPFIIGELGQAGLHPTGKGSDRHLAMRAAQKNVTLLPEFAQTTLYIPTALYVRENLTSYNKGFHYFGRADTFYHIGKAFGKGMLQLLEGEATHRAERSRSEPSYRSTTRSGMDPTSVFCYILYRLMMRGETKEEVKATD